MDLQSFLRTLYMNVYTCTECSKKTRKILSAANRHHKTFSAFENLRVALHEVKLFLECI